MRYIISRYNQDTAWIKDYTDDCVLYDRSEMPLSPLPPYIKQSTIVPNIGSDIYDKFTFIIDNYDNLPDVAVYTKCNIFKYITKEEFDKIKDNTTFTPILTQNHESKAGISFYANGIYWEINNGWYLAQHRAQHDPHEVMAECGIINMRFVPFAPGSNYIVPRENILKHPKEKYEKLRSYLEWDRYPGEAQIIERGLYTLFTK